MALLVQRPLLAFVPALILLVLGRRLGRWPAVAAGGAWLVYGLYELGMHARILCTGECNIRIDLLVLHPLLLVATLVGVVDTVRGGGQTRASR